MVTKQISIVTPQGEKVVKLNPYEWKKAIDHLKPGSSLRSQIKKGRSIHPITEPHQSLIGRIWAKTQEDSAIQNTSVCLKEMMKNTITRTSQLHTALHLLRALDSDPKLLRTFEKKELHDFRQEILHVLVPHFIHPEESVGKMKELQSLWVLANTDVALKKKLKQDPRYPIVKATIVNIDHTLEEMELQQKRLAKFEEITEELNSLESQTRHYLRALHALRDLAPDLEALSENEQFHFDNILLSYTLASSLLSHFQKIKGEKKLSMLSIPEFDQKVGELAEIYRKNFFQIFPQLRILLFYDPQLKKILHKIKDIPEVKTKWWDKLDPETKHSILPWDLKNFNVLKVFHPSAPIENYLEKYENQLIELQTLMPKHTPAWKKLTACLTDIYAEG